PAARVPADGQAARRAGLLRAGAPSLLSYQRAPVVPAGVTMDSPGGRDAIMANGRTLNATTHVTDARAFVGWLDTQASVDKRRKAGTTGYCMGGSIVLRTAAALPERVGAGAT